MWSGRHRLICLGASLLVLVAIPTVAYLLLPSAMPRDEFRQRVSKLWKGDSQSIRTRTADILKKRGDIERASGSVITVLECENVLNPKFTYPTLQATLLVRRSKGVRREFVTFVVSDDGALVLVALKSDPVNL